MLAAARKPLATSVDDAQRVVDAVAEAGVVARMILPWRHATVVRSALESSPHGHFGGHAHFVYGGFRSGPFASQWRSDAGPWPDLAPHLLDILEVALGPICDVEKRTAKRWASAVCTHEGGQISTVSGSGDVEANSAGFSLYGPDGVVDVDATQVGAPDTFAHLKRSSVEACRSGDSGGANAAQGLHLQQLLDDLGSDDS